MLVKWEQLKRILILEESFAMTGDDYESYVIPDNLVIQVVHRDFDNHIYTAQSVQLIADDGCRATATCVIQLEGQQEEPVAINIQNGEIEVSVFRLDTPNELFWPV